MADTEPLTVKKLSELHDGDEVVCFAAPSHPLAGRARIDPKELRGAL